MSRGCRSREGIYAWCSTAIQYGDVRESCSRVARISMRGLDFGDIKFRAYFSDADSYYLVELHSRLWLNSGRELKVRRRFVRPILTLEKK